jgi:peptidyl-prolyl cis-trans isomerase B (cyclophilin B)
MFKKQNQIWWYLVGAIIMFVTFSFFTRSFLYPYVTFRYNPFDEVDFQYETSPSLTIDNSRVYKAYMQTTHGVIVIDLYPNKAPVNVNNFIYLAQQNFYNGTKFHRVFSDFLIQGGDRNTLNNDPSDDGKGNAGYKLNDEIALPLTTHAVAMANSGPNTNSSQFFIVIAAANDLRLKELNGKFTVIGQVVEGISVLESIADTAVDTSNPNIPRPKKAIKIQKITIL